MSTSAKWDHQTLALEVNGASLELDTLVSHGRKPPVLFLHGFGSTKEDYRRLRAHPEPRRWGVHRFRCARLRTFDEQRSFARLD